MNVVIKKSRANGIIQAPPSKSMAHRLLICSFLAGGKKVSNTAGSMDIRATKGCLDAILSGDILDCIESGSTLRFLIPICLLASEKITLTGSGRLFERDLSVYENICKEQGLLFELNKNSLTVCGPLRSGRYRVRGDISSQFISGLLFALPLVSGDSVIEITGKIESRPYIDMTISALSKFGVFVSFCENEIKIKGGQKYMPCDLTVEGDYSNAAFLDALSLFSGNVSVTGLDENSLQGDKIYKEYFKLLCKDSPTLDVADCPDLAPILMAVAAAKNGCRLINTKRLKIKESDRGAAMQEELSKMGVTVRNYENEIIVSGNNTLKSAYLSGHNDHRIVMALSVLCSLCGGEIEGAEAVSKSYPDFFEDLRSLGIEVKII